MASPVSRLRACIALVLAVSFSVGAQAGDDNKVYLFQSGNGNSFLANQSSANNTQIGGFDRIEPATSISVSFEAAIDPLSAPASQVGDDNQVSILLSGDFSQVYLLQDSSANPADDGNAGTIEVSGAQAFAALSQIGAGNNATLIIDGDESRGALLQNGDHNVAELRIPAIDASGTLIQNGDDNITALTISALGNPNVTYTLNGSNVSATVPVQVFSNGADIVIQQNSF